MAREKSLKRSINFAPQTLKTLDTLAIKNNTTTSELVRSYVEKGLSIDGYKQDIDFIADIIRQEFHAVYHVGDIERVMQKQTDRIAKMLMKTGKLSSAEFFLMMKVMMYLWNDNAKDDFDQLLTESISLGIDYMQKKDFQINSFLEDTGNLQEKATGLGVI